MAAAVFSGLLTGGVGRPAWAFFTSAVSVAGNTFSAATSFPTYPQAVEADSPIAYYREDDSAGYDTAADSETAGPMGAYGQVATPTTIWSFDEGSGTTTADLADGASTADPGTLEGSAGWTTGQEGGAVSLNGTSSYVQGAGSSIGTNYSFSVGAWVYLTDTAYTTDTNVALSQDGSSVSAFELGCFAGKWAFSMPASDSSTATVATVTGDPCSTSSWTYLSATYQATSASGAAPVMALYENGTEVASGGGRAAGSEWVSTGPFVAGAAWAGSRVDFWHGDIDDVSTTLRAVYGRRTLGTDSE
ncbi:MAG TPA: LamG-like jellyroll fold domain-containing protein [Acidimicrobiales bacterium]|nr:LamG-like jellyroll fold domain-containing protein [Acidimicrobiales bacterium]